MFYRDIILYKKGCARVSQIYQEWLAKKDLGQDLREELENMREEDIEEAFYKPLSFGTGGMRGIMGAGINRFNVYTLKKAVYGFAKYLLETHEDAKDRGVAIAYDNRHKSDEFAKICVEVLAHHGIKSFLFESLRPTPLLSYAVRKTHACGGIMITASHNPSEYNGFKIYDETGCQLVPKYADKVINHVNSVKDLFAIESMPFDQAKDQSLVYMLGRKMDNAYIEDVLTVQLNKDTKKTVHCVFTPLHGASREIGLRSLQEAGFTVTPVEEQMIADPNFKTVSSPNPEDQTAFEYAIKYGHNKKADLLIATDPDGDRLGLAVRHKNDYVFLNGNQTGAIFIDYILSNLKKTNTMPRKGIIFNTIVTSDFGAAIARTYGVEVVSTLTGFKFIGEEMAKLEESQKTFIMAYEESYGYVIKDFVRDKDSIQAMVLASEIANYLKAEGKTLIDYLHELYDRYGTYRETLVSLVKKGKSGEAEIKAIMDYFRHYTPEVVMGYNVLSKEDYQRNIRYEDGHEHIMDYPKSNVIKFNLDHDAWFVLRPSGTEPKLKIYIALKGTSIEDADQTIEQFKDKIMSIIDSIKLQ